MQHRPATRHALALIAAAPVMATVIGSIFNIWYNVSQVKPLLGAAFGAPEVTAMGS